jgi:LCP family protein required for cell wall assembly
MTYTVKNQRKHRFPWGFLLVVAALIFVLLAVLSVNEMRKGNPGFLTNLWQAPERNADDPLLADNPDAIPIPNEVKTILLLGSDYRPELGYRTDVMLLVGLNTRTDEVHLISFPRDLWVNVPGLGEERLNTAFPYGDWELLSDTFAANFGFRPDHYAMVDFQGFKHLIDVLDGIVVTVGEHMEDECHMNDSGWCVVEPGEVPMDSDEALWYVRARLNSSDFDRTRRAQEVIQAIAKKAFQPSEILNLDNFVRAVFQTVKTDMQVSDTILYALPVNKFVNMQFSTFRLTPDDAVPGMTNGGASVLYPNYPAIREKLLQFYWVE